MANQLFKVSTPVSDVSIDANAIEPHLPAQDPNPVTRAKQLAGAQADYQFDWSTENAPGVPLLKALPTRDFFSIKWLLKSGAALAKIRLNEALPPFPSDDDRAEKIKD